MKRCAVVCNGHIGDYPWLAGALRGYDAVFAADGGLGHCRRAGVTPTLLLGDLDSLAAEETGTIGTIRHPAEKDRSDMEIAVDHAIERGYGTIDVFGALGGRIDHELCNVMVCARRPGVLRLVDAGCVVTALDAGLSIEREGAPGDTVTLAALDDGARCVTRGLRYPLNGELLPRGSRGLSNVAEHGTFSVSVNAGAVLVIHLKEGARVP